METEWELNETAKSRDTFGRMLTHKRMGERLVETGEHESENLDS